MHNYSAQTKQSEQEKILDFIGEHLWRKIAENSVLANQYY